ncbi:hypothetical protein BDW02DRAFT_576041 [Decorospora gaudefroyi]|uniref:DUF7029 domain-containing protein n=1 Tax=Decorospora gaudefroyi TaxID=184978 RepID=A0A6A5KRK6_9PLEO|nr:hypothetical protein BDW02DRAFT_576041 [Decorospora gaudefroyi]
MRFVAATLAFASIASAYPQVSSTSPQEPSSNPLSPASKVPAKVCEVKTFTVYETAYGGQGNGAKATPSALEGDGYSVEATLLASTPTGAKPTPSTIRSTSSYYEARPTGKGAPSGQKEEHRTFNSGEDIKLQPCNHWSQNTKDPNNLVPKDKTQLYYAEGGRDNAKPSNEFYFGVIDLLFKGNAVVLEHSNYIRKSQYSNNQLTIDFTSAFACDFAKESWSEGTILVSSTAGCSVQPDDEQCYFKVEDTIKSEDGKSIVVKGYPQARDECTEGGEAHWGRYKPEKNGSPKQSNGTASYSGFPSSASSYRGSSTPYASSSASTGAASSDVGGSSGTGSSFASYMSSLMSTGTMSHGSTHPTDSASSEFASSSSWMVAPSHTLSSGHAMPTSSGSDAHVSAFPGSNSSTTAPTSAPIPSGLPSTNSTDDSDDKFGDNISDCKAPTDTKYNLPTACLGQYFDLDLDDFMGYGELSADDIAFLNEATGGLDSRAISGLARRALMHQRHLERKWSNPLSWVANKVVAPLVSTLKTTYNVGKAVFQGGVQLLTTGTVSGSIKESFNFALPDGTKADAKQVESPWGPAALIAAYGTESKIKADKGVQREGYLNIYCVGCGAQGSVELAGRATWAVGQGITQGEVEAWADLKVAMKVGVDAQIKLTREWKKTLFQKGLPQLSFGPIVIGPSVRVDARATLEAGAEGRILAGAEFNWNRAYAKVDMIDPSKSTRQNFDPVGHPVFEAEGSLYVGAELGLPIGMHFGITVASFSKTVGLINEPMIKGIAKAAIKAELADGQITAGFTLTEGCQGIHANLSWRNKLVCNVLDVKEFELLDTGYKSIKSMCIPLGKQTEQPPTLPDGEGAVEGGDEEGNGEGAAESGEEESNGEAESGGDTNGEETPEEPTGDDTTGEDSSGDDTGESDGQNNGEGSSESSGEEEEEEEEEVTPQDDFKRSISSRQTNSTLPPSRTGDLPAGIREITDSVKNATENVNYALAEFKTVAYDRTDGYEFTKLIAGDYNVMYCSNGNMYLKQINQSTGLGCDELFAYSSDAVVGDGQGRYFYYHDDAMAAAGVSRLRLGDEESPVMGTSAVAMSAWNAEAAGTEYDAEIEGLYTIVDYATDDVYWLTFCTYKDGQPPKVFVVAELDTGMAVLEGEDVKYSVTGGDVEKCYPLMAVEDPALKDTWADWDDSFEDYDDWLEFDEEELE